MPNKKEIKTTEELVLAIQAYTGAGTVDQTEEEKQQTYRYKIYVRKSTKNKEEKQARSIEDQIKECNELAEKLELKTVCPMFVEMESAKEPDIRPKFRQMLDEIQEDKYDGIIAWHPDRLARNMKEGGEIIDLIDKKIIKDLKFRSFTFQNDSTRKMLLGIAFVLSKQYSDKLSTDVSRGIRRSIAEGKNIGEAKHGYYKDRNQFMRPDEKNFILIKQAFEMRLEGKRLQDIANYLVDQDYPVKTSHGQRKKQIINVKLISDILRDPVYTGVSMYGEEVIDLTEAYDFVPTISVENFLKINKLTDIKKAFKSTQNIKSDDVQADLLRGLVFCGHCQKSMQSGITPKKKKDGSTERYYYYCCRTDKCPQQNKSTRAKVLIDAVCQLLEKYPLTTKKAYTQYLKSTAELSKKKQKQLNSEYRSFLKQKDHLKKSLRDVEGYLLEEKDEEVKRHYKGLLKDKKKKLEELEKKIEDCKQLKEQTKDAQMTFRQFVELFQNLPKTIRKTRNMEDLDFILRNLYTNFVIIDKKVAEITQNSPFGELCGGSKYIDFTVGDPLY